MAKPYDPDDDREDIKNRIIGLSGRSFRKSYYPQLRSNLAQLERFRALLDCTSDFVILLSLPDATVVDANAALGALLGRPLGDLIGKPFLALGIDGEDDILGFLRSEMETRGPLGKSRPRSTVVEFHSGTATVWLELSYRVAVVDECCYGVMVGRDISERRRNEVRLAELLEEKQAIVDNAMVGIALLRGRQIVTCNRRFEEIFGYSRGTLAGQPVACLYRDPEEGRDFADRAKSAIARGENFNGVLL
ncbi:MAG TPA: PAS domain-containing protein, partial [Rhodocyclaceae bacterium]|nr:PAS domain-containing protein [Rhodocyclaceae bacterium]